MGGRPLASSVIWLRPNEARPRALEELPTQLGQVLEQQYELDFNGDSVVKYEMSMQVPEGGGGGLFGPLYVNSDIQNEIAASTMLNWMLVMLRDDRRTAMRLGRGASARLFTGLIADVTALFDSRLPKYRANEKFTFGPSKATRAMGGTILEPQAIEVPIAP